MRKEKIYEILIRLLSQQEEVEKNKGIKPLRR